MASPQGPRRLARHNRDAEPALCLRAARHLQHRAYHVIAASVLPAQSSCSAVCRKPMQGASTRSKALLCGTPLLCLLSMSARNSVFTVEHRAAAQRDQVLPAYTLDRWSARRHTGRWSLPLIGYSKHQHGSSEHTVYVHLRFHSLLLSILMFILFAPYCHVGVRI